MTGQQTSRLDSWKEIAAYLARDVSTVIRWEKEKGLPVHRLPGGKRQAVFGLREEIDLWLLGHPTESPADPAETEVPPRTAGEVPSSLPFWPRLRSWLLAIASAVLLLTAGAYFALRPPAGRINSLAVLPLKDARLGIGAEEDYFAYAMTDALTTELSKIRALRVTSLTSAMRFKDSRKSLPEIARELGVDAVVEGTVAREGNQVRITVQLIEAATDRHLMAESYQRDLQGVLALQGEVARAIALRVRAQLSSPERTMLAATRPAHPQAIEMFLRGRFHLAKWSENQRRRGADYFRQAIQADPGFAPAYAALSYYYSITQATPAAEALPRAKQFALKALELDPHLPASHEAVARFRMSEWDWVGAEEAFRNALELEPGHATARRQYALLLSILGRHQEALALIQRMKESDPLNTEAYGFAAEVYYFARNLDRAIDEGRAALLLDENNVFLHADLGLHYATAKRYAESVASWERALALAGRDPWLLCLLAHSLARQGRVDEARKIQREVVEAARRTHVSPLFLAMIHFGLGELDQTFEMLERAYRERNPSLYYLAGPTFDSLRYDPRMLDLLRRMNLPPQGK